MDAVLRNDANKTDLNLLIADRAIHSSWSWEKEIVVTYKTRVKTRSNGTKDIFTWIDETHEEADNRMLVHIKAMISHGITNISVRSRDQGY